ncbi:MAG: insulinase family protein [Acidobacteria bacterium]|jgi:predicted Zn-dependent peptidase|nr:MAG: insulinase family protein [Acidobacteriota bacterium]
MRFIIVLLFLLSLSFGGARLREYTLENGVKIILKETHGKGLISGSIFIRSGTHGEKKRGVTNLMAILFTKGTKKHDAYKIASMFEDYGGFVSASASDDYVEISFSTKIEGLREALDVIRSMLSEPLFEDGDLRREKQNTLKALRSRKERGHELAMDRLRQITYRGTSYEYAPLGKEEDLESITREDVVERWKEVLKAKNTVVSLVGDFKVEEVLPLLKDALSELPKGEYAYQVKEADISLSLLERVKREGSQATILCAFDAPAFRGEDYFAFKVLDAVLGDGMTSKLFKELREKKGYAYAVYSTYPTRLGSPRLIAYIGTSPEKKEQAIKDLIEVVKRHEINPEDVELAKNKIIGDFLLAHQTRARQAWYLGFFEVMGFGWRMDLEYTQRIKEVDYQKVRDVRERFLKFHHCVVVEP